METARITSSWPRNVENNDCHDTGSASGEKQFVSELDAKIVELYKQLHAITNRTFDELASKDIGVLLLIAASGEPVRLGIDQVTRLDLEFNAGYRRDHLIQVHLAELEARLYRSGYCGLGTLVKVFAGNYRVSTEEVKRSIILDGFPFRLATVSSYAELVEATPLKLPSDTEYSELYEGLIRSWGGLKQGKASEKMWCLLESIYDLLPTGKIGDDFRRERRGKEEPLPMYVRNEIHHPTKGPVLETEAFQQDKRIGYAIMKAWLSEDGKEQGTVEWWDKLTSPQCKQPPVC